MKYIISLLAISTMFLGFIVFKGVIGTATAPSVFGGASYKPAFGAGGTTNGTTTINTTSTQLFGNTWVNFAGIWNPSTATIYCYLDNKTAASSSVATGAGQSIGQGATTTFSGEPSASWGPLGLIPYVGAINCLSNVKVVVGIISN